jgi:phosphoglucomutase
MRPSGTEPKIKFYMGATGENIEDAKNKVNEVTEGMKELMK